MLGAAHMAIAVGIGQPEIEHEQRFCPGALAPLDRPVTVRIQGEEGVPRTRHAHRVRIRDTRCVQGNRLPAALRQCGGRGLLDAVERADLGRTFHGRHGAGARRQADHPQDDGADERFTVHRVSPRVRRRVPCCKFRTGRPRMSSALARARRGFVAEVERRNPHEPEFVQAACELAESVMPLVLDNADYRKARILERMAEPDRVISFRVCWEDDAGEVRVNRAWRVQFNRALGPYKGGMRFSAGVTPSVLKFLGFEQTFKNALTGLPMGGGKGGADFDPHGASEREVMRFCKALMAELYRHIAPHVDVPAGDVGVGSREIGYLFGEYSRLTNRFEGGVLTGKGLTFGGSAVREEATGYGVICMLINALEHHGRGLEGQRVAISGAGNVALHAAEKACAEGARVVTLSDSDGTAWCADGFDAEQIDWIKALKLERRGRISEAAQHLRGVEFHDGGKPWRLPCDIALPAAIENDIDEDAARALLEHDLVALAEGANMPVTANAGKRLREAGVVFLPAKAANAGGVAVSGLEQSQNATRVSWSRDTVERRLHEIMRDIHDDCVANGGAGAVTDYVRGANVAAFERVARAMLAYGIA